MKEIRLWFRARWENHAWWRWVVPLGFVAMATILACARVIDLEGLFRALRGLGAVAAVTGFMGAAGVIALQSLRRWMVVRPLVAIRYRDVFAAVLLGNFFNAVLPARAGDALRIDDLSRSAHTSRATLVGTELVDFLMDKAGWLPAFAILLFTGRPLGWMNHAFAIIACVVAFAVIAASIARRALHRAARERRGWIGRIAEGFGASSPKRLALAVLTIAALPWLWEAGIVWGFAHVAGLHLGVLQAFTVLTAFNVATIVPVPGNFGTHEAASSAALVSFGVSPEHALALAVTYHATQIGACVLGGSLVFLSRRLFQSEVVQ